MGWIKEVDGLLGQRKLRQQLHEALLLNRRSR